MTEPFMDEVVHLPIVYAKSERVYRCKRLKSATIEAQMSANLRPGHVYVVMCSKLLFGYDVSIHQLGMYNRFKQEAPESRNAFSPDPGGHSAQTGFSTSTEQRIDAAIAEGAEEIPLTRIF